MIRFLGIAICVLFLALILKDKNRALASVLSIGGACLLLFTAMGEIREITDKLKRLAQPFEASAGYISLMLKALAITLLTQLVSDICRDNGENALAGMTEATAKIVVIALVLPLFETVITIVDGLVK